MFLSLNSVPRAIAWLILLAAAVACQSANNSSQPEAMATPTTAPSPSATPTPTKLPPPPDWTNRWLQGIPCRAPCWEGITPGKTTASDAVEILNRSPLVAVAEKKVSGLWQELGAVAWVWVTGLRGSWANYSVNDPSEVIDYLSPNYPDPIRLQEVMQAYGEPSHVVVIAERPPDSSYIYFTHWVIFLPQGLVLSGGGPPIAKLDENTWFNQVTFLEPTEQAMKQIIWPAQKHPEWVLAWQGFRDYEYYCRDITGGMWCRGELKPRRGAGCCAGPLYPHAPVTVPHVRQQPGTLHRTPNTCNSYQGKEEFHARSRTSAQPPASPSSLPGLRFLPAFAPRHGICPV